MREGGQILFKASYAYTILRGFIFFLEFYAKLNYYLSMRVAQDIS